MEVAPPVTATFSSCLPTATPTNGVNSALFTPTITPTSDSPDTSNSNVSSLTTVEKYEIGIGVGVGVPILVALVAMIVLCVRMCKRRRKTTKRVVYNLDKVYGTSAEDLHGHPYLSENRTVPVTMYANARSPLANPKSHLSPALRNKPMPLPPQTAMDVPLVYSSGPRSATRSVSPPYAPYAFEAFHPSKRIDPVTNSDNRDPRPSEQSYPRALQRPESGSSCYTTEEPYPTSILEMGP
ncbi:MAG: hypothetical protein LQ340_005101 [Diploschistes diacapsis]|nr:MAG: hypothetical protein LQ340_005101 [Diploschistes diacapsis]